MNLGLEGKVAVITGGSDGIGKAAALSLSREGARVAVAARDQGRLDDAVSEISSQTENPRLKFQDFRIRLLVGVLARKST